METVSVGCLAAICFMQFVGNQPSETTLPPQRYQGSTAQTAEGQAPSSQCDTTLTLAESPRP